ncbi:MFS transporter [Nocardia stercoris]|uniref:MFS transporter n=2 Tax=Nocardia stercoris TaxID=2483361 RepID=A0A3M2LIF3_9NOCA|nr:MFS transporter [Nocardia stercoris]
MIVLDVTVMNVALPRIRTDLHFTPTGLSWVMDAYTLTFGGLLLLGGRAGDLFGRRRLFLAGIGLFTLASLAGGLAPTAGWLLASRVAQGIGGAMAGPNTLALLTTTFSEPARRIRVLALFSGMSSAGFAIGLIVGGLLTEWFGWRSVMFINVPFGVAIALLGMAVLPEAPRRAARLDLPGAVTATAGVATLVYGFISAAADGWGNTTTISALLAGGVLLSAFVALELRHEQPLLPLHLFTDRTRAAAYANMFLGPMAGMSMFFFVTEYLQEVRKMSALATGFAFLPTAILMFAMIRLVPRLLPRLGPKPLALTGTLSMAAGLALLTRLTDHSGYFPLLFVAMLFLGCGIGLAFSPLNVIIMSTVEPAEAGAAGGALQTVQQVGAALGLAILVTVFGTATRGATGSPAHILVGGITTAFGAAVVIAVLTVLVALTFPGRRQTR